jgi:hypothetical protein
MAEVDPLTGSPLSKENRNLFKSSTVSASTFRGTDIGAKNEMVEQSKKFTESQQQNQKILENLQQQFQSLQNQINLLAQGINTISGLIQRDSASEKNLLLQQEQQETRYNQRKIRIGRENELEQKIENAISAPVQALSNKIENIFGRVGSALSTLFLGWLGIQGIKALQAWRDKDKNALEEVKNNVLKNIGFGVAAIAAIKLGLTGVKSALLFVTRKIGSLIVNAIKLPFQLAARGASALGASLAGGRGGGAPPRPPSSTGSGAAAASTPRGRSAGGSGIPWFSGAISLGLNLLEGKSLAESATIAGGGMVGAKVGGKTGATIGSILGPKGALVGGFFGGIGGFFGGEELSSQVFNLFSGQNKSAEGTQNQPYQPSSPSITPSTQNTVTPSSPSITPSTQNTVTPSTPLLSANLSSMSTPESPNSMEMTPPPRTASGNFAYTVDTSNDSPGSEPKSTMVPEKNELTLNLEEKKSEEKLDKTKKFNTINLNATNFDSEAMKNDFSPGSELSFDTLLSKKMPSFFEGNNIEPNFDLKPEQIEPVPTTIPNIKPLEDPAPNVIVAASPQDKKMEVPGPVVKTDVPLISSSNPDNFYVLYSQLNYNVVM